MQIYISTSSIKNTTIQKRLSIFDLPEFVRNLKFEGLEISDREILYFNDHLLNLFSHNCSQNNCGLIIDVNADLSYSKEDLHRQEIKHVRRMIHIANKLNLSLLRICLGGQLISIQKYMKKYQRLTGTNKSSTPSAKKIVKLSSKSHILNYITRSSNYFRRNTTSKIINLEKKKAQVIYSLKKIIEGIDRCKIKIGIENHWGVSNRPKDIMEIIDTINSPYLGTCPDFTNFSRDVDPFKGLELMAQKAVIVHAKCYGFNNNWEDKNVDFKRCLKIFKKAEYNGPITVEYEGESDELRNCRIARQLILNTFQGIS